jgi:putative adhesin
MPRTIVLATLLTALVATSAAAEQWSKSYTVDERATLTLRADDASVHVSGWSEPRIQIDVEAEGWKIGPGGLRLTQSQSGDHVSFGLREPAFEFHFGFRRRWTRIEVHVPERTILDAKTGDGSVVCEGVKAPARLDTGDGNISVDGLTGTIDLHTGDGRIDARNLDGALTATTGDGRVRIHGRFDALDLSSSDGGLTVDVAQGSRMGNGWHVRTGDGPVVLRLPSDLRATLDVHTGDGGITVDLPVQASGSFRDNALHGTLNGGGPELAVRTADGSVMIEEFLESADRSWGAEALDDRSGPGRRRVHSIRH